MDVYVVKKGKYEGFFFDEDNMKLAIADYPTPEYKKCNDVVEAINYYDKILGKVYPVSNGRIIGIFTNWPDCQSQTNGFPSAKFMSTYIFDDAVSAITSYQNKSTNPKPTFDTPKTGCVAYVDGSFNLEKFTYGWGAVIFFDGEQVNLSGCGNDLEDAQLRNVAGEIIASKCAIKEAIARGYDKIDIYYDYEGIEKWATGEWKRKKKQTIAYYNFIQNVSDKIKVNFFKVKSHTGIELNELVDRLAKDACGVK